MAQQQVDQSQATATTSSAQARAAADQAEAALVIAKAQYAHGLVTGLNVPSSEQAVPRAQDQLAQSDGALTQARASLYKALGGGWSET